MNYNKIKQELIDLELKIDLSDRFDSIKLDKHFLLFQSNMVIEFDSESGDGYLQPPAGWIKSIEVEVIELVITDLSVTDSYLITDEEQRELEVIIENKIKDLC